jgi:hypothetical protein
VLRGIAVAGSWVGGCWSRLWCGRWSLKVANVAVEDAAGVSFVVDQPPVGALGADAADEPFRVAVRLRRAGRDLDHVDALGGEHGIEGISELGIPVADQKRNEAA